MRLYTMPFHTVMMMMRKCSSTWWRSSSTGGGYRRARVRCCYTFSRSGARAPPRALARPRVCVYVLVPVPRISGEPRVQMRRYRRTILYVSGAVVHLRKYILVYAMDEEFASVSLALALSHSLSRRCDMRTLSEYEMCVLCWGAELKSCIFLECVWVCVCLRIPVTCVRDTR